MGCSAVLVVTSTTNQQKESGDMATSFADAFVRSNVRVNGTMPGKPIVPPVKEKGKGEEGEGVKGTDPACYIVFRLNGPCERFINGESARKAYRVLGGVRLLRVNKNGSEVELEVR